MIVHTSYTDELFDFFRFLYGYFKDRFLNFGGHFERFKDIIVAILVVKRGKYSQSFLNTSFFVLVSAAIVGGPVIAENNPLIAGYFSQETTQEAAVLETDIYAIPIDTTISQKPRAEIINYTVEGGDTLESIGKKFDVSVDSIKWASNLKTVKIKPGQIIQIPPVTGVVHKVASGETIYSIAKKYRVDAQNIVNFQLNDFADLETFALSQGQLLVVPDGILPEERITAPRRTPQTIAAGQPGTGTFIWPTSGNISQSPVWYHMALDIANRSLPPVLASDTGTVSYAGCVRGGYGCHIRINHANGYETLYAHLSQIDVSVGMGISRGTTIGRVGSTGRSTGPHLHFEIRSGGRLLNPLGFLK